MMATLDAFTAGYVDGALWSSMDEDGAPLGDQYERGDIADETLAQMKKDCENFQSDHAALLTESGLDDGKAGLDFWLTRNRHGAGFWDEGNRPVFKQLTDAAHAYGSFDLYVGDDGEVIGYGTAGWLIYQALLGRSSARRHYSESSFRPSPPREEPAGQATRAYPNEPVSQYEIDYRSVHGKWPSKEQLDDRKKRRFYGLDVTAHFVRERQFAPGRCAPASFRAKKGRSGAVLTFCCRRGHYDARAGRCAESLRLQSIARPR